jgi:hypothetical protein
MKGIEKEKFQNQAAKSHAHFIKAINEEIKNIEEVSRVSDITEAQRLIGSVE